MRFFFEPRFFRTSARVAGRLIALGSMLTVLANGCSDGVKTEPAKCTGGNAGAGGCGGSCTQTRGGGGSANGAMGGAPATAGESSGGSSEAGSSSGGQAGSSAGGDRATGGEAQAGADAGGAAGSDQGETGGSSTTGGSSGSSGSSAKGGASGTGGSGGTSGSTANGGAGGTSGSTSKGGSGGGSSCPQTVKNTRYDESSGITKSQDQECKSAYSVNECGKGCAQITPTACLACEVASTDCAPTTDCSFAKGDAMAGPAAGVSRAQLCSEALACFRRTNCAKPPAVSDECYCGTAGTECFQGKASGPCKAEIEAGFESEDGAQIASRFGDPVYGAGLALLRLGCDRDICPTQCFRP